MTVKIQRLLNPELCTLSDGDRRMLIGLEKRIACLVQPLNFLLHWSKKRDSCVQQVVLSAQELLFDVCSYVERFVPQDGGLSIGPGKGNTMNGQPGGGCLDSEKLEYYLRELEFACTSVNMAVSVSRAIDSSPLGAPQDANSDRGSDVSLSALLRASRRIQEMRGHTGDLCACPGRLYSEAVGFRSAQGPASSSAASARALPGNGEAGVVEPEDWAPVLSLATFKVVAQEDARRGRRRYRITVDSRLPLSQRDKSPSQISRDVMDDDAQRGLNATGPLLFPIEVALDAHLVTTANMSLPVEPSRCLRDLGIDSLVLTWGTVPSASDASCLVEMCCSEFPDAVLLPETTAPEAQGLPRPRWASPPSAASMNRCPAPAPGRFAFVFDSRAGEAQEVALTPLDALYLARLCALDDGQLASDGGTGTCPPHLQSSDEVLAALLQEGVSGRHLDMSSAKPNQENGCKSCPSTNGTATTAALGHCTSQEKH